MVRALPSAVSCLLLLVAGCLAADSAETAALQVSTLQPLRYIPVEESCPARCVCMPPGPEDKDQTVQGVVCPIEEEELPPEDVPMDVELVDAPHKVDREELGSDDAADDASVAEPDRTKSNKSTTNKQSTKTHSTTPASQSSDMDVEIIRKDNKGNKTGGSHPTVTPKPPAKLVELENTDSTFWPVERTPEDYRNDYMGDQPQPSGEEKGDDAEHGDYEEYEDEEEGEDKDKGDEGNKEEPEVLTGDPESHVVPKKGEPEPTSEAEEEGIEEVGTDQVKEGEVDDENKDEEEVTEKQEEGLKVDDPEMQEKGEEGEDEEETEKGEEEAEKGEEEGDQEEEEGTNKEEEGPDKGEEGTDKEDKTEEEIEKEDEEHVEQDHHDEVTPAPEPAPEVKVDPYHSEENALLDTVDEEKKEDEEEPTVSSESLIPIEPRKKEDVEIAPDTTEPPADEDQEDQENLRNNDMDDVDDPTPVPHAVETGGEKSSEGDDDADEVPASSEDNPVEQGEPQSDPVEEAPEDEEPEESNEGLDGEGEEELRVRAGDTEVDDTISPVPGVVGNLQREENDEPNPSASTLPQQSTASWVILGLILATFVGVLGYAAWRGNLDKKEEARAQSFTQKSTLPITDPKVHRKPDAEGTEMTVLSRPLLQPQPEEVKVLEYTDRKENGELQQVVVDEDPIPYIDAAVPAAVPKPPRKNVPPPLELEPSSGADSPVRDPRAPPSPVPTTPTLVRARMVDCSPQMGRVVRPPTIEE